MSSSSCVVEPIARLVADSFAALRADAPRHYARFAAALQAHRAQICVEGERITVTSDGVAVQVDAEATAPATVRITTDAPTILAVLDARCTLAEAVQRGALAVVAPLEELDALRSALLIYVRGGVRSTAFPGLVARLRARASVGMYAGGAR